MRLDPRARRPIAGLALLFAIALAATLPALAWTDPDVDPVVSSRNFQREAHISADGRKLVVKGNADCVPADGVLAVSVSLLQAGATAAARGFAKPAACTDEKDGFTVALTVGADQPAFAAGPAEACAFATTQGAAGLTGADQWCTFVKLVVDPAM
jgi:hypothetical protein